MKAAVEHIKSAILVVLLLSTILLLYFYWDSKPFQNLMRDEAHAGAALSPAAMFRPDRVETCFGNGAYAVSGAGFDTIMDCFREFAAVRNLSIEEIPESRYDEVMAWPSINAVFDYYVPFSAICEIYGIDRIAGADSVDALSAIGYSSLYDDRIYVFDDAGGRHFRILGSGGALGPLSDAIAEAEAGGVTHFALGTYVGEDVKSGALCPIHVDNDIRDIPFLKEDFSAESEGAAASVRSFFSDNFDFVRRIEEESGTVIYMYGYGKIVVVAGSDGTLEFRREDDERGAAQLRYLDAFERASSFLAAHDAFGADGGALTPYMKEVIPNPDGKRGFRFVFGLSADEAKVHYLSGAPIIVDVTWGRVSSYKRDVIIADAGAMGAAVGRREFSAINLLASNLGYMGGVLGDEGMPIEKLAEMVTRFDFGRLRPNGDGGTLTAVLAVAAGGVEFYFGLDDGLPLGHSRL